MKQHIYVSKTTTCVTSRRNSSLIPCGNCVNYLKEYLLQIAVFQMEKVHILFQTDVFRRVEEIQVSLRTIPSMLQVGVSTALLASDN
jgi:hypothetical protein